MHTATSLKSIFFLIQIVTLMLSLGKLFPVPVVAQAAQHPPGRTAPKKQVPPTQSIPGYEMPLWMTGALPILPDVPPPEFNDAAGNQGGPSFEQLFQEFTASSQHSGKQSDQNVYQQFANWLQNRAQELASQYGASDPRAIRALEDMVAATNITDHDLAKKALDRAINLRAPEGNASIAYWMVLKQRCVFEVMDSDQAKLPVCEQALEIRSHQPGATPLELATWLRLLGSSSYRNRQRSLDYQERADSYYVKIPGISPAFLASDYRRLTILALSLQDTETALRLNEMTNRYLAHGDATAQKAMVPADAIRGKKRIESDPKTTAQLTDLTRQMEQWKAKGYPASENPLLKAVDSQKLTPEQRQKLEQVSEIIAETGKLQAASADRPQDQMLNSIQVLNQSKLLHPPDDQGNLLTFKNCGDSDKASGAWDFMLVTYASQPVEQQLANLASMGFGYISVLQSCSQPQDTLPAALRQKIEDGKTAAQQAPDSNHVVGYGTMVRFKGMFTEVIAPRRHWLLPGYGEERNQSILDSSDSAAKLNQLAFAKLPPEKQREFSKLSPDQRTEAINAYWLEQEKNPQWTEEQKERLLQDPAFQKLRRSLEQLKRATTDESLLNGSPLAFLEMLKPHEAFVDIYEYKLMAGEQSGTERYFAVISNHGGQSKRLELGSAKVIDSAISSFQDAINSGSDGRAEWKAIQLVIQPIFSALPAGTQKVWLSPDSAFSFVPFTALLLDMGSPVQVAVIPSAYDFVRVRSSQPLATPARALLVGDLTYGQGSRYVYMDQTKNELAELSRKAQEVQLPVHILSGSQVTRNVVARDLQGVRFVHFSTHGELDDPAGGKAFLKGRLALSMANSLADGSLMTADNIRYLDLSSAELVTLSACDTGKGRTIEAQGMLGFQTAFMAAGTRSLLFSLWKAPLEKDANNAYATSVFMDAFYEGLWKKKLTKAEALREAQLAVRSNPRFANPRFWANWVLVGEAW